MNQAMVFLFVWGIFIFIPVFVDFTGAIIKIITISIWRGSKKETPKGELPSVSVIIPAYNEENNIEKCLNSIKTQDYPKNKLEILIVDDGSTDNTRDVITNGFKYVHLYKNGHNGKAFALNTGVKEAKGDIIITMDADTVLEKTAIKEMVYEFMRDKDLAAASGNITIEWKEEERPLKEKFFIKCEFLEYLNAFRLGRQYQSILGILYTLSGAFSAFRADLLKTTQYEDRTVTEDFDLSVNLHREKAKIKYAPNAIAYVEPKVSWEKLYSQRLRWRCGQIEVCSLNKDLVGKRKYGIFGLLGMPFLLVTDHTLAFPRIIWTFLIPIFPLFGYPYRFILYAVLLMYLFYVFLDLLQTSVAYLMVDSETKTKIENSLLYCFLTPFYRIIVFYFKMSAYINILKKKSAWETESPKVGIKNGIKNIAFLSSILSIFRTKD
ncbi:MAG: glycosyltransferase [Methanomicrobia archaeon]|nr:glycosyltransferase [Methanomicrobia archaeon]